MAIIATYPPRQCGIATFTSDLRSALGAGRSGWQVPIVAVDRGRDDPDAYPPEVSRRLSGHDPRDYRRVAAELNRTVDVVLLQHEYGIFGGSHGRHVLEMTDALTIPLVTTFHTVRAHPSVEQLQILRQLVRHSARVVAMSERSRMQLVELYGADSERIDVIPHGVPVTRRADPIEARQALGLPDGPMIFSFGLLGPGKRIELVIEALARIGDAFPDARLAVLGATHPEVKRRHGEQYREELLALAVDRGVGDRVSLVDDFVEPRELATWLQACDLFVTAYPNAEQSTSGTLSLAVAAGRACISTPYEHARELLADGRGLLVPFGDVSRLAAAMERLLGDPEERRQMGDRARTYASQMAWPIVAARYRAVLHDVAQPGRLTGIGSVRRSVAARFATDEGLVVPSVERGYLDRLRAPVGIWQHATGQTPNREHGTCTDDVARALLVDLAHDAAAGSAKTAAALRGDLAYLEDAFNSQNGRFRNFRAADGSWLEDSGSEDAHGRALVALAELMAGTDEPRLAARAARAVRRCGARGSGVPFPAAALLRDHRVLHGLAGTR